MSTGFMQDDQGNNSTMRAMSIVALIASLATGAYVVITNPADSTTGLYVFTAYLLGAFVPKAVQKFAEIIPAKK